MSTTEDDNNQGEATGTVTQLRTQQAESPPGAEQSGDEQVRAALLAQNTCPECAAEGITKQYKAAGPLGKHRRNAHGVMGSSDSVLRKANGASTAAAKPAKAKKDQAAFDPNKFLKMMFPNGLPADRWLLNSTMSWLDESERLWNNSMKQR